MNIEKRGFTLGFSWEMLAPADGHSEPIGLAWLQRIGWVYYLVVWGIYRGVKRHLERSRHYVGVSGYEWEPEEFRRFTQRTKWVRK